jgi:hypothetical protein
LNKFVVGQCGRTYNAREPARLVSGGLVGVALIVGFESYPNHNSSLRGSSDLITVSRLITWGRLPLQILVMLKEWVEGDPSG